MNQNQPPQITIILLFLLLPIIILLSLISTQLSILLVIAMSPVLLIIYFELSKRDLPIWTFSALFIIITMPILRIVLPSNLPLYIPDILIGLALLNLIVSKQNFILDTPSLRPIMILLFSYWIPSTVINYFYEALVANVILETTYILVRQLILISFVFIISFQVNTHRKLRALIIILTASMFVSGLIATTQSFLPPTHPVIIGLDELSARELIEKQERYLLRSDGVRARGLIGSVNGVGMVLSTLTIIGLSALISPEFKRQRFWLSIAIIFALSGALVTYSRSTYLALALGGLILFAQQRKFRTQYVITTAIVFFMIFFATENLSLFNFNRVVYSFQSIFDSSSDFGEVRRLEVPQRVFDFIVSNPIHIFVGYGESATDLIARRIVPAQFFSSVINEHNVVATVILRRGLITGFIFLAIYISILMRLFEPASDKNDQANKYLWLIQGARASSVTVLPSILFTHAPISVFAVLPYTFFLFGYFIIAYRFTHFEIKDTKDS